MGKQFTAQQTPPAISAMYLDICMKIPYIWPIDDFAMIVEHCLYMTSFAACGGELIRICGIVWLGRGIGGSSSSCRGVRECKIKC